MFVLCLHDARALGPRDQDDLDLYVASELKLDVAGASF